MKKTILFLAFVICVISLFAQQSEGFETTTKLQLEQQFSERIENTLFPFVGENIVIVKLTLMYPSYLRSEINVEKNDNLEVAPVPREKIPVLYDQDKHEDILTKILFKEITVYLQKNVADEMVNFVRENLPIWFNIDQTKGDTIAISKVLTFMDEITDAKEIVEVPAEKEEEAATTPNYYLILGIILLLILLIIIFVISSGMKNLSNSLQKASSASSERELYLRGGAQTTRDMKSTLSLDTSNKTPLPIRIIEQEDEKINAYNFDFLEKISIESFYKLIRNESDNIIAYIISSISPDYAHRFIERYPAESEKIVKLMMTEVPTKKADIEKIRQRLFENYEKMIAEDKLKFDGKVSLIRIINSLTAKSSQEIVDKINNVDKNFGEQIKEKVFLFDNFQDLTEEELEKVIMNADRNMFIRFLASIGNDLKEKFFHNLTTRASMIIEEELDNLGQLLDDEKEHAVNDMLNETRRILNYK